MHCTNSCNFNEENEESDPINRQINRKKRTYAYTTQTFTTQKLIKMDESLSQNGPGAGMNNNNNNNNINNTSGGNLVINNKDDLNGAIVNNVAQYTIPGVLHFIQHEWTRFELERSQWDVDRAELQARIAVLLGERKGQESLKSDLIRRIKMLEYALKQERVKFHRLKYGCDPPNSTAIDMMKPPVTATTTDDGNIVSELAPDADVPFSSVSNITWRQGRQLLRQYLQEVGYTEAIIDVRSNRVRSLLGLNRDGNSENLDENYDTNVSNNNAMDTQKRVDDGSSPAKKSQQAAMAEAMLLETEAAVLANFEFLAQADSEITDDDDMNDGLEISDMVGGYKPDKRKGTDDVDAEANDVLNELNLLTEGEKAENRINDGDWGYNKGPRHTIPGMGTTGDDDIDQSLGELAQLTVNNDSETAYDDTNSKEPYRKTWNAKYTLRSHFDCVRALAFHPTEPVLITGSEDHTLKLWNLQKTVPAKKSANLDVEPLYTFRGHSSPVLCLAINASGDQCYSGSLDGIINCWNLPNSNIDPYDNYDADILRGALEGHTDGVWGLSVNNTKGSLLSASADGTVKLWSPLEKTPLLQTFTSGEVAKDKNPTSVDFVQDELDRIVAAYQSSNCVIYDTETSKSVLRFEALDSTTTGANSNHLKYIYKVISHPTLPIIITAHEDRHIRFWDSKNGSLVHSMVAHLEAVTSLAIDAHGLYLLSGSHDCSIRLWNMDTKTCVQEITAHRKKFDESIFDVAFHPSKPYIASAGADAIAKVFV
ncbi:striatin-3-like [Culicoides brevitarsis]|uniref:striatin-3-like n=1 Tax=Culicoides brevitarsis TaxID=469753 RepID=UPI00307C6E81